MTKMKKQNALVFYVRVLIYTLIALGLRVLAAAPLFCLFVFEDWKRLFALLCPLMWLFGILPLRFSFAQAMTQNPRHFSFDTAFSFSHYGEKLKESVVHALNVFKWGIPLAAMLSGAAYAYTQVDALTIFQSINELGNTCVKLLSRMGMTGYANNFMLGVTAVGAVFGLGVLVWIWGAVRNSASRYIWAIAASTDRLPRAEMRRRLTGRRMAQLGVALINLMLWLPFLYIAFTAVRSALGDASTLLMMAITTGEMPTAELIGAAAPVAGAFAGLYLPLLPLRRWNTAAFAMRKKRIKAETKAAA